MSKVSKKKVVKEKSVTKLEKKDPVKLLAELEADLAKNSEVLARLQQQEQVLIQSIWKIQGAIEALKYI